MMGPLGIQGGVNSLQLIYKQLFKTYSAPVCVHRYPPAQSPATTVFDPSAAVRVQLGHCRSSLGSVLPQVNTDEYLLRQHKHFPRHMVNTSLSAIAYNACAVPIS